MIKILEISGQKKEGVHRSFAENYTARLSFGFITRLRYCGGREETIGRGDARTDCFTATDQARSPNIKVEKNADEEVAYAMDPAPSS